jgi:DNA-binding beta-propeller fold protein YncE
VYKINVLTNTLVDSIFVPKDPNSMVLDKDGKLWVVSSGGINDVLAKLVKINLTNNTIESEFTFSSIGESPIKLCIDSEGDNLYFLNSNIYSMSIYDATLPITSFVGSNGKVFYGLSVNKATNEIYVTDAKDYQQQGAVYRYYENGNLIDSFTVGIIPQGILF